MYLASTALEILLAVSEQEKWTAPLAGVLAAALRARKDALRPRLLPRVPPAVPDLPRFAAGLPRCAAPVICDAPWQGNFGLGTLLTLKIGRLLNPYPYLDPQKIENSCKATVTSDILETSVGF